MREPRTHFIEPLPVANLGQRTIYVDAHLPVAAVVEQSETHFVTWGDAPLPQLGATPEVIAEPRGVWVVYTEADVLNAEETINSTAIHISTDLKTSFADIGVLTAIGADAEGLWCSSEPYPVVPRSDGERDFTPDRIDIAPDSPVEEMDDIPQAAPSAFVPLRRDAAEESDTWPSFGWYVGLADSDARDVDIPEFPTPSPPVETGPVTLKRFRVDGGIDELSVNRLVSGVEVVSDRLRLTYHPTGPVERLSDDRRSASISYPTESIDIDASPGLPRAISVEDYVSTPSGKGFPEEWLDSATEERQEERAQSARAPRIDISNVPDARWRLPIEDPTKTKKWVDAVVEQLSVLDEPNLTWFRSDNRWHRIRSDYRDLSVSVAGVWPDLEVVAEFRYHPQGDPRFRFRVPVFDAAGRPAVPRYLTIYLQEDLDTTNYDDAQLTEDGFIEV